MNFNQIYHGLYQSISTVYIPIGVEEEDLTIRVLYDSDLLELTVLTLFESSSRTSRATFDDSICDEQELCEAHFRRLPFSIQIKDLLQHISCSCLSILSCSSQVNSFISDKISEFLSEPVYLEV